MNDPYDCRSYSSPDMKHHSEREDQVVGRLIAIFVVGIAIASLLLLYWERV